MTKKRKRSIENEKPYNNERAEVTVTNISCCKGLFTFNKSKTLFSRMVEKVKNLYSITEDESSNDI